MSNYSKKIELFANVAIIVVALLLGVVLVKRYLLPDTSGGGAPMKEIAAGSKVSLPDVDWAKNGQTLLVVLQKGCHFCSESAGFYQRLVRETSTRGNVHLVAVLPQETSVGKQYLDELGVPITDIRQATPASVGTRGTPTLILVNNSGVVTDSWIGKLTPEEESKVLSRLQSNTASIR